MFVKICGITNEDDALLAVAMGADAVGFVFAPSPRQIAPQQAYDITRRLPPEILTVGVFRDEHPKRVVEIVHRAGREGRPAPRQRVAEPSSPRWPRSVKWVIKAYPAGSRLVAAEAGSLATDLILLDAPSPGSGQLFDWTLAGEVPEGVRLILAGGLDPDNVADAVKAVEPWGVDVSTGVERAPGQEGPAEGQALRRARPRRRAGAVPRRRRAALRLGRRVSVMGEPDPRRVAFGEFGGRFVPGDARAGVRGAGGRLPGGVGRRRVPRRARRHPARLRRPPVDPHRVPQPRRSSSACACCSSARTSTTPARTRSTTCSARRCWPSGWARPASSPRPAPASTASPRPPRRRCSGWSARCTWAPSTSSARRSTSSACACSAPRSRPVESGSRTLKDAVNEAMRDWVATVGDTHYCLGSVMGPHPYPWMVRELHRVIGDEAREQCRALTGGDPDVVVACVGGGSNAAGLFSGFVDTAARLVGVEPAGGAAVGRGVPGVVHGMRSYLMQDEYGQVEEAHSVSAGLDYPGVGPEHSYLAAIGRAEYPPVSDAEVLDAFALLARTEGILCAFEPAHALAWLVREAPRPRRLDGARVPVRSRRQGRRPGDGPPRRGADRARLMEVTFRAARDGRAQAARAVHHRWLPGMGGRRARRRRRRRRRDRDRHPVLRPGDGRTGDPAGVAGGARRRRQPAGDPRRRRRARRRHPAGRHDVLQPRPPRRPPPLRRPARRRRRRGVHPARPPAGGGRTVVRGGRRRRRGDGDAGRADGVRRAPRRGSSPAPAASSTPSGCSASRASGRRWRRRRRRWPVG